MKWWDTSWNPVVGCTPASPGCDNCYAKALHDQRHAALLEGKKVPDCYARPFERVQCLKERLDAPLHWRKPRRVFVNSMTDLFHENVPFEFLDKVFAYMALASQHTFMVLTKRPERMREYVTKMVFDGRDLSKCCKDMPEIMEHVRAGSKYLADMPPNVWMGVTTENQAMADERIPILLDTPAAKRFVSVEPMLGPVNLAPYLDDSWCCPECKAVEQHEECHREDDYSYHHCLACGYTNDNYEPWGQTAPLDWVICGGETGPNARPMHPDWARSLRDQCAEAEVPFMFKQWGEWVPRGPEKSGYPIIKGSPCFRLTDKGEDGQDLASTGKNDVWMGRVGRLLDGREHNGMPEVRS